MEVSRDVPWADASTGIWRRTEGMEGNALRDAAGLRFYLNRKVKLMRKRHK